MIRTRTWRLGALIVVLAVFAIGCGGGCGCGPEGDTRFTAVNTYKGPAVAKEAVSGDKLNKFFPKAGDGWDVVYTQEKQGMSQAELKKGGTAVAQLSIFDTLTDAKVADEYKTATEKLSDKYPLLPKGKMGTGILVGDRYQVQVRTLPGNDFSEADRKAWLAKFDLAGLATLQ